VISIQDVLFYFVKNTLYLNIYIHVHLVRLLCYFRNSSLFSLFIMYVLKCTYPLFSSYSLQLRNLNIVVGITTRLRSGRSMVRISLTARDFSLLQKESQHRLLGLPGFLFCVYRGSFPGVKRPGSEVNHSPSSSADIKNEWSYTSTPPLCVHGMDKDNCTVLPFPSSWVVSFCFKLICFA
jgi:hypothetical protein